MDKFGLNGQVMTLRTSVWSQSELCRRVTVIG
jgi:hypothetical protein